MRTKLNSKKGVAGLNVFLSLVAMLFMIGIIIMVFAISGSKLKESVETTTASATIGNETLTTVIIGTAESFSVSTYDGCSATVLTVTNATGGETIGSGNYTTSACTLTASAGTSYNNTNWNVTYSYTYTDKSSSEWQVVNDTVSAIDDAPDWFPTFIVLGAMVVLILLVVIIINSIRKSGITGGA